MANINIRDLEWFQNTSDFFYGRDKNGNVYGIGPNGELRSVPKDTIDPEHDTYLFPADIDEVEFFMARKKEKSNK